VALPDGQGEEAIAIRRVGVIGAGTMGSGIAQVLATAGFETVLVDVSREQLNRAESGIDRSLARLLSKDRLTAEEVQAAKRRITCTEDLGALGDARLVVEAIVEELEPKQTLFRELDRIAPGEAILASNTSSISITQIAAATRRAPRVIGMHFMNPVPVMRLVEVIRGEDTSDETLLQVMRLCERLQKVPIEVNDYPGFVSNRVLLPMLNEAFFCVMEGVATPEAIDGVMQLGMNHPMGPLRLADLIGLDVCLHILSVLQRDLGDPKYRPCPLLRRMVAAGKLGRKSGRGFFRYEKS